MSMLNRVCIFIRKKIVFKIFFILFFAVSIPMFAVPVYSYYSVISTIESDFIGYKTVLCSQIARNINENIERLENESVSLVYDVTDLRNYLLYQPDTIDDIYFLLEKKIVNWFISILMNNHRYDGIGLINMKGYFPNYSNWEGYKPIEFMDLSQDWMKESIGAKGSPVLSVLNAEDLVSNAPQSGTKFVAVSRMINDSDYGNLPIGISLFCQSTIKFGELATNGMLDKGETALIFDTRRSLIYASSESPEPLVREIRSLLESKDELSGRYSLDGEQYYLISSLSTKTRFNAVLMIPESILTQKNDPVKKVNVALAIFLTLSSIAISFFLSYLITNPLKRLMLSFEKLKKGDFEASVAVKGMDEFAEICKGFNLMVLNIKNLIHQKYELEIHRRQAELESLQSKINPHFLYNTLTLTKAIIRKRDYETAFCMIQSLSDVFRYSLNRGQFLVTLSDELEHAQKYLSIQKQRFQDKFNILMDIDEDVLELKILRLTLQPIIENAIIHGLEEKSGTGNITISAKTFKDVYHIYIADDGPGILPEKLEEINRILNENPETNLLSAASRKVGIYNVNSRIKLYFGSGYGLKVSSVLHEGTVVRITLPIDFNQEEET